MRIVCVDYLCGKNVSTQCLGFCLWLRENDELVPGFGVEDDVPDGRDFYWFGLTLNFDMIGVVDRFEAEFLCIPRNEFFC